MTTADKLDLVDMEDEIHDAINMMRVLDERICNQLATQEAIARLDFDEANLTIFLAGQALDKTRAVLARWTEIFESNGGNA